MLGPIYYAIYVSPLFDHHNQTNFADDNFIIRLNSNITELVVDLKRSLLSYCQMVKGIWPCCQWLKNGIVPIPLA
jgi:hypothetical protein